jgi:hypothetical protein
MQINTRDDSLCRLLLLKSSKQTQAGVAGISLSHAFHPRETWDLEWTLL